MKTSSAAKVVAALRPRHASPIMPIQRPKRTLRRLARSAKKPDGKLATPAVKVRTEARAPACERVRPREVVIRGNITATTALKRCSVMCAVEFAANLPHVERGVANV